jgi:hypothetical protein
MSATFRSPRNVIQVVNALDLERYMPPALNESEIPSRVVDSGKIDHSAVVQTPNLLNVA